VLTECGDLVDGQQQIRHARQVPVETCQEAPVECRGVEDDRQAALAHGSVLSLCDGCVEGLGEGTRGLPATKVAAVRSSADVDDGDVTIARPRPCEPPSSQPGRCRNEEDGLAAHEVPGAPGPRWMIGSLEEFRSDMTNVQDR